MVLKKAAEWHKCIEENNFDPNMKLLSSDLVI